MPVLAGLTKDEQRALLHKISNESSSSAVAGQEKLETIYDNIVGKTLETELAKASEEANYDMKNRYRLNKKTLQYADKKRMPLDESKVVDLLRNQHIFRAKIHEEVGTYQNLQQNTQLENGILNYLSEAAYGEMEDLIREVGIKRDTIKFNNVQDWKAARSDMQFESDRQFDKLANAMFTPLDMTDYEDDYVGYKELPGALPINRQSWLGPLQKEAWPQTDAVASIEMREEPIRYGTNQAMKGLIEDHHTVPEPEDQDFYGKEEEDEYGDDYGEEGEEGEEGEADYGDYDEEEEEEEFPNKTKMEDLPGDDRFFRAGESLRGKYSEVEIEQFMKLLNVKPYKQW